MANSLRDEITKDILKTLDKHPEGLMVTDIADKIGHNRLTVAKYLDIMLALRHVRVRNIGHAKLFYLKGVKK